MQRVLQYYYYLMSDVTFEVHVGSELTVCLLGWTSTVMIEVPMTYNVEMIE